MKLEEIKKVIKDNLPYLKEKYNVSTIGVFGSYATGDEKESSDVDVLVEFDGKITLFGFAGLKNYLEDKLDMEVDLVMKKALKPLIKDNILNEVVYV